MSLNITNRSSVELSNIKNGFMPYNPTFRQNDYERTPDSDKTTFSTNTKIAISAGITIAIGILGILGRKGTLGSKIQEFLCGAKKAAGDVQQEITGFSKGVQDLINKGRITTKEAELFERIKNLKDEEFLNTAYNQIAEDMGLTRYPELIIDNKKVTDGTLGHAGKAITIYPKGYTMENRQAEMLNTLRHELEHYKQSLIIYMQKGDVAYKEAHRAQIERRLTLKAICELENNPSLSVGEALNKVLQEEAAPLGKTLVNPPSREQIEQFVRSGYNIEEEQEFFNAVFKHETPIELIRTICPNELNIMKSKFNSEELAQADDYLEGVRKYGTTSWLPQEFWKNGKIDIQKLASVKDSRIGEFFTGLRDRYFGNIIEVNAIKQGEGLRDRFIDFLNALTH